MDVDVTFILVSVWFTVELPNPSLNMTAAWPCCDEDNAIRHTVATTAKRLLAHLPVRFKKNLVLIFPPVKTCPKSTAIFEIRFDPKPAISHLQFVERQIGSNSRQIWDGADARSLHAAYFMPTAYPFLNRATEPYRERIGRIAHLVPAPEWAPTTWDMLQTRKGWISLIFKAIRYASAW